MLTTDQLTVRKGVSQSLDPATAAKELYEAIYHPDLKLGLFYCSSDYDLEALAGELKTLFGDANLIGCTSAGEITPSGYLQGALTGVSLCSGDTAVVSTMISNLTDFEFSEGEHVAKSSLQALSQTGSPPTGQNTFGFLLIDGLSVREESVVHALYTNLGDISLFGGSAADDAKFEATYVYCEGAFHQNVAVFTLVQTSQPFMTFKTQHFVPTDQKMVVTKADPSQRIVFEINGEIACEEYARLAGLDGVELTPTVFAAHPVVVRIGGDYFVRSIMYTNQDGSITFACAIDEGIVLTGARGVDMVENLTKLFDDVRQKIGSPSIVLGCDCLFRTVEMDQKGIKEQIGEIMKDNNVVGFSTYGEQYNAMHVNQTFTGVAIGG